MIRRQAGFTLVELMITMVVFVFFIVAASQVFTGLLTQFKQQSKMAETNIEGIVGLEILRQDIEHAGYGLPWNVEIGWGALSNYLEAASVGCTPNPSDFNDAPNNAPKAILSGNNASFSGCGANSIFNGSDYLVIKAVNVGRNVACQKGTLLKAAPFTPPFNPREWTPALTPPQGEDLAPTDRVIVLRPGSTDANGRTLVVDTVPAFFTTYNIVTSSPWPPADTMETRIVYGVDPDTDLRMPFNRADYYIWRNSTSTATDEVPDRCAPNTGVLRKAVISQNNGLRENPLPLLDCVADMQVIFGLDTNNNGIIGTYTDGGTVFAWPVGTPDETAILADITASFADAATLRQRLKEVRVYILAHEGQRDVNHTYPTNPITVGEFGLGRSFNFVTAGITNWQNYRWKIYTIVLKPTSLLR